MQPKTAVLSVRTARAVSCQDNANYVRNEWFVCGGKIGNEWLTSVPAWARTEVCRTRAYGEDYKTATKRVFRLNRRECANERASAVKYVWFWAIESVTAPNRDARARAQMRCTRQHHERQALINTLEQTDGTREAHARSDPRGKCSRPKQEGATTRARRFRCSTRYATMAVDAMGEKAA